MEKQKITLRACDVAIAANMNKYQRLDEEFVKKIKEYNNLGFMKKEKVPENLVHHVDRISKIKGSITEELDDLKLEEHEKKIIETESSKKRGIDEEINDVIEYGKDLDIIRDEKIYLLKIERESTTFIIKGKIDGRTEDTLYEFKHRKNRLFSFLPLYERVQMEMYMRMTNLNKAFLIQTFNDEQSSFAYNMNDELFDEITARLDEFTELYNESDH